MTPLNMLLVSNFIFTLHKLDRFERKSLNVCTLYSRTVEDYTPLLCGCSKQLGVRKKSKRLFKICQLLKKERGEYDL
jgi:hypothetical protein